MRRNFKIVLLSLGVVLGYGFGIAHIVRHRRHDHYATSAWSHDCACSREGRGHHGAWYDDHDRWHDEHARPDRHEGEPQGHRAPAAPAPVVATPPAPTPTPAPAPAATGGDTDVTMR